MHLDTGSHPITNALLAPLAEAERICSACHALSDADLSDHPVADVAEICATVGALVVQLKGIANALEQLSNAYSR